MTRRTPPLPERTPLETEYLEACRRFYYADSVLRTAEECLAERRAECQRLERMLFSDGDVSA